MDAQEKVNAVKVGLTLLYNEASASDKQTLAEWFPTLFIVKDTRPVMERIKTFDDVLADQGITAAEFIKKIENDTEDEAAYKRAKLIALALNEGELDPSQTWWEIRFNRESGSGFQCTHADGWFTHTNVGARLSFKSYELAVYAGKTFASIYKPLILILKKQ